MPPSPWPGSRRPRAATTPSTGVPRRSRPRCASDATPGELWLDSALLDSGVFSWGVVQHEYAHEVDFFLLDDARRAALAPELGGQSWWQGAGAPLAHGQLSCERFASTLAWAYWPSARNSMKPQSKNDESSAMAPAAFRALLAQVLATP